MRGLFVVEDTSASTGDFNGDGRDDMLLRHSSGTLTNWLGNPNGSFADNWGVFNVPLPTSWQVQPDHLI